MQFSLDLALSALLKASESSCPAWAQYQRCKFLWTYSVSGHEEAGWALKVNPDLTLVLTLKSGELRASILQVDLKWLEDTLVHIRETQNFTLWCLGTFFWHIQSVQASSDSQAMADQLFKSIQ